MTYRSRQLRVVLHSLRRSGVVRELALSKVYQLIEPGPVVLVTTKRAGRENVMTMSWHMVVDFEPPLIACVVSENDFSFAALMAEQECVIAVPTSDIASVVVEIGNCSGRTTDKFEEFALTPVHARLVAPPLIAECFQPRVQTGRRQHGDVVQCVRGSGREGVA